MPTPTPESTPTPDTTLGSEAAATADSNAMPPHSSRSHSHGGKAWQQWSSSFRALLSAVAAACTKALCRYGHGRCGVAVGGGSSCL